MIVFLFLVVSGLLISQVYLFHIYKDKIKKYVEIKPDSVILKPIPKSVETTDVEGFEELIRDLLISVKEEEWPCEFLNSSIWARDGYEMKITSLDNSLTISVVIRVSGYSSQTARLIRFSIKKGDNSYISVPTDSGICNDLLIFLWDFVLDKHTKENKHTYDIYRKSFDDIRKSLKSLNRNRILAELLK
jgi:hypothetical protein